MKNLSTAELLRRIKRVQSSLKDHGSAAILLSSAPASVRSRDTLYSYRQNSDFYYLTGCKEKSLALLISTEHESPLLYAPPVDPHQVLWEGKNVSPRSIARKIKAKCKITKNITDEILSDLKGHENLFYQNIPNSFSNRIAEKLLAVPSNTRRTLPSNLSHSDVILEPLRLIKSREEVSLIREAARITDRALRDALPLVRPGTRERDIAATINYSFQLNDAETSFPSIVASGPAAATLHYENLTGRLKKDQLLLIDCGAEFELYAADITRALPVSGKFEGVTAEIYNIVLEAQSAVLRRVKPGVKMKTLQLAAARVITQGLRDLKVLKGSVSILMEKHAYRPYFPHGIGHSLGLDVHDLSSHRDSGGAKLKKGMVITVEPGIYFAKQSRNIPACGVRIEDDVLVTSTGCKILTPEFPKSQNEIEKLMQK